jgi:hypothetical protein
MKLYEQISKIMALGTNIAFHNPDDNATFLRMIDLTRCTGKGRK